LDMGIESLLLYLYTVVIAFVRPGMSTW